MGDTLDRWIRLLRDRVGRGDLAGSGPVDIGYGTGRLPGETTIRIMLADLDHLDSLPEDAREWLEFPDRRADLLVDFRRLRELIG